MATTETTLSVKPLFLALLLGLSGLTLAACNTVEGAGEDIESSGDAISDAAD
ncbi:MAG: entericidin A/B family lipoprotein [Sphingomonadales bacterium]